MTGGGETVRVSKLSGELLLRALREKLVEESLEALDASSGESILEELADVEEVIEGVLKQLKTKRRELIGKQRVKKAKAGGFEEGFVLVDTSNPSAQTIRAKLRMFQYERTPIMAKWVDQREHSSATERLLNLVVSLTNEQWSAESPEILLGAGQPVIRATIDGTRTGASLKLAISIFMPPTQLKLIE